MRPLEQKPCKKRILPSVISLELSLYLLNLYLTSHSLSHEDTHKERVFIGTEDPPIIQPMRSILDPGFPCIYTEAPLPPSATPRVEGSAAKSQPGAD